MRQELLPVAQEFLNAAEEINHTHQMARHSADTAISHAIRCGELLMQQKKNMAHGEFQQWVAANCEFSLRQAQKYMKLSKTPHEALLGFSDIDQALGYRPCQDTITTKHTGDEESYTPEKYIVSARRVMGEINLDPASNEMAQLVVKADRYFTVEDDGLAQEWAGNVWMNPPYTARVINTFIEKAVAGYSAGSMAQAIILTNNNTDTSWFHLAASVATAICFTKGRINFNKRDGSTSSPTNGQCFFYFGDGLQRFYDEFSQWGLVVIRP